jgi:hypothetical protein
MHRHKTVAQILLILSIFSSVLAAPVLRVREMPGAVAVRVPAEGAVAVLEKRIDWPWSSKKKPQPSTDANLPPLIDLSPESEQTTNSPKTPKTPQPDHPPLIDLTSDYSDTETGSGSQLANGHSSGSQPTMSNGHVDPLTPSTSASSSPEHPQTGPQASAPASPEHPQTEPQTSAPTSPEHSGSQSTTTPPKPVPVDNAPPKTTSSKPKIMTPEKIKATKYAAVVGLVSAAYLSLLEPEIIHGGYSSHGSSSS